MRKGFSSNYIDRLCDLFDRYLNDWIYLIVCIFSNLILAYYFKKLETKVDGLHIFKNFS